MTPSEAKPRNEAHDYNGTVHFGRGNAYASNCTCGWQSPRLSVENATRAFRVHRDEAFFPNVFAREA